MSSAPQPSPVSPVAHPPAPRRKRRAFRFSGWPLALLVVGALAAGAIWYGMRAYTAIASAKEETVPSAKVLRGDVTISVTARGSLRGGNSEMLLAPMTGGLDMHLTSLLTTGEPVKAGQTVAEFDTTEQEYKLKEAQADLAEAEAHLAQARSQNDAQDEEDRYALLKAESDVRLAELDVRKNPLLPALTAKENTLTLDAAKDHLTQLQHNLANRKATNLAAIGIQEAARGKAESQAKTAKENIEAMTLKAHRDGYVSVSQNSGGNMMFYGMVLPIFQVGDQVRPGMAVAEIPDLKNWEVTADIGELDRGHLSEGEPAEVSVIALPNRTFNGHVKELGGTTGNPWNRHFECKIALDNPSPELRPGMSANLVVTTDRMKSVLSLPAQAMFESDGHTFVYVQTPNGFTPRDVKLVRRNEMRVVVSGVNEGERVALSNPTETAKKKSSSGALQSLPK